MENTKVILITGATDGLGKGVASALVKEGYVLLLHGRNPDKGKALVHALKTVSNNTNIYYFNSDFSKLDEVVTMAKTIQKQFPNIDVLINNAGIGCGARTKTNREVTKDGYEKVFTINYLAHVLLTTTLLPNITKPTGRIINVSSIGQTDIDFEDIMIEKGYQNSRAYCQSKTAQIMYTLSLAEQLKGDGITVNALHHEYQNDNYTL